MEDKIVMYIFVNSDLDMSKGKSCSQVGHAVQLIVQKIMIDSYEKIPTPKYVLDYMKWRHSNVKIILRATEAQLEELRKKDGAITVFDEGITTQVKSGSLTAVGFYPSNTMGEITKDYKLL